MFARLRRDLRRDVHGTADYRDLLVLMTRRTFILQYRRAVMGVGWAIFMPVINTIVFTMIFTKVAPHRDPGALSDIRLLRAAALEPLRDVAQAERQHARRQQEPVEQGVLPARGLSVLDDARVGRGFLVGLSILAAMMVYYRIAPTAAALFLPVLIAVQLMFTAGLAMLLAPANLYYRDVKYILDVLVAVGMFATPVVYPTRQVSGALGVLLQFNPLAPIIDGYRAVLLRGQLPDAVRVQRPPQSSRSACSPSAGSSFTERSTPLRRTPDRGQPGITFERVWKRFCRTERHTSLRDLIPSLVSRAVRGEHELKRDEFWALKDVTLEARRGEALGIIGPNGAGKSTVLKLLTKILRPTEGRCELRGRVGALIEVSAGFHPDLTGRENVYLQGAIMGMSRSEIDRKFDDIVDFAGIPEFLETPVRRYSSGMNARLGFAIAAHLQPDVLIVDEVLSVGDFAFQQRAYARLQEMVSQDVTAIVVSHQLERIASLCKRAVLLRQGEVAHAGPASETIAAYVSGEIEGTPARPDRRAAGHPERGALTDGRIVSGSRVLVRALGPGDAPTRADDAAGIGLRVRSMQNGRLLFWTSSFRHGVSFDGLSHATLDIDLQLNTPPGVYAIETAVVECDAWPVHCGRSVGERDRPRGEELRRRHPDESRRWCCVLRHHPTSR